MANNLLLVMGSGNRDEANFENGEVFNIHRENSKEHLSFGYGIHFCLGSPLAKLEFKTVLEEVTRLIPDLKIKKNKNLLLPQILRSGLQWLWCRVVNS